ncbi:MAG: peptidoglycan-binding protein [Granulosicoccus sp.]
MKRALCFSVALLLTACSEQRVEQSPTQSVTQVSARAIADCDLPESADVDAYLIVSQGRYLMPQSSGGESASLTVELTRGELVVVEIVLRENNTERVIATTTGTVPQEGNSMSFQENHFDLSCDTGLSSDQDFDGDGIANSEDDDADGDNTPDVFDPFIDLDGDSLDDGTRRNEEDSYIFVSERNPCGPEEGFDSHSRNSDWADNCTIRSGGRYSRSVYIAGVQRIVYCSGFGEGENFASFADGELGPTSVEALREFQRSSPDVLVDDGVVNAQTWAKLQSKLERLEINFDGSFSRDSYGFTEGRCANTPLFFQNVDFSVTPALGGGWTMGRNPPNEAIGTAFSFTNHLSTL